MSYYPESATFTPSEYRILNPYIEQDADKAIEMIREVDRLREEVTRKLQKANEQLNSLRDRAAVYRKIIKQNYLQDQWAGFGLQDKR